MGSNVERFEFEVLKTELQVSRDETKRVLDRLQSLEALHSQTMNDAMTTNTRLTTNELNIVMVQNGIERLEKGGYWVGNNGPSEDMHQAISGVLDEIQKLYYIEASREEFVINCRTNGILRFATKEAAEGYKMLHQ